MNPLPKASSQVDEIFQGVIDRMQQMYGPPRVAERRMDRPYICGVCGKNHPTSQCIPKSQGGVRPKPQVALWCDFHKTWGNHSIENCFNRIQHMQEQALENAP